VLHRPELGPLDDGCHPGTHHLGQAGRGDHGCHPGAPPFRQGAALYLPEQGAAMVAPRRPCCAQIHRPTVEHSTGLATEEM
jgi:hypothetical protein